MSKNQQQNNENEEDYENNIHQALGFRQTVCKANKSFSVAAVELQSQSPSCQSPQREVITSFRDKLSCQNVKKELLLQQQQSQQQLESMKEREDNLKLEKKNEIQDNEHHIFINENSQNPRKITTPQESININNRTFIGFQAARNHYQDLRHTTSSSSQSPLSLSSDNKNNIHRFRQTLAMFKQQKYQQQQMKLQQQYQQWQETDKGIVVGNVSGYGSHQEQPNKGNQNSCNMDQINLTYNIQKQDQLQQRNKGQVVGYLCKQNVVNRLVLKQTEKHRLAERQRFSLELSNFTASSSQMLEIQANSLMKPSQVVSQRYSTPSNNQLEIISDVVSSGKDRKVLQQLNHSFYSGQTSKQQQQMLPQYQDKNIRKRSLSSSFSYHNSRRASSKFSVNLNNNNGQLEKSQHQEEDNERKKMICDNNSYIPLKIFKRNHEKFEDIPRNTYDGQNSNDVEKQEQHQETIVEGNCKESDSSIMIEMNHKLRCKDKENTSDTSKNTTNNRRKTSQLTLDQHWERLFETPQKQSDADNHLKSNQNLSEIAVLAATTFGPADTSVLPGNPRKITTAIEYNIETEGDGDKNSGRSGSTFGCKMPPKHIYNKNIQSKRCSTSAVNTEERTLKQQNSGNDNKRRRKSSYQRTSNNGNQLFVEALGGFNQVQSPYQAYLSQITPTINYLQSPQSQRCQFNSHSQDPHNSTENKTRIHNPFRRYSPGKQRIFFTCTGEKYGRMANNQDQSKENTSIKSITHGEVIPITSKSHQNNHILIINNNPGNAEVLPELEGDNNIKKSSNIVTKDKDNNNGTETNNSQKILNNQCDDQKNRSTSPFRKTNFVELQFRDIQKDKNRIVVPSRSKQQSSCEKRIRRMHDLIAESELQSQLQKQFKSIQNQFTSQNNSPSVLKWYINGTDNNSSNHSSVMLDRYDDSSKRGVLQQQSQDIIANNTYKRGSSQSESRKLVKLVKYYNNKYGEKLINNNDDDKAAQLMESQIFRTSNTPLSRQTRKRVSEICPWNSQQLLENDDGI